MLAVAETLLVLLLYVWAAWHYERQWWLLLSAVAAPIILLRSEGSKARGVALLQKYWEAWEREKLTEHEKANLRALGENL